MLTHEKLGKKIYDAYVRFLENKEASAPNLILKDLSSVFLHYYMRGCGFKVNYDCVRIGLVQHEYIYFEKKQEISERTVKKIDALRNGNFDMLVLKEDPDVRRMLEEFLTPYNNDRKTVSVKKIDKDYRIVLRAEITEEEKKLLDKYRKRTGINCVWD